MHPRRRLSPAPFLWPPLALVAAGCAAAAIAAQWGRVDLSLDILTHFAPFWLAGSVLMLAAAALFRRALRWGLAALALTGVVAAGALMAPEFLRPTGPKAPADAPGQLKIVQFNVWHGNPDPDAVLAWLDRERPDIAVVEENSAAFRRALAGHPAWHVGGRGGDVLILSRTEPVAAGPAASEGRLRPHPITRADFRDGRGAFTVIGVHEAWPTDIADQQKQEQLLADAIAQADRARLIVTGDFNSTPWSFSRRRWDRVFGITRRDRAVFTWPARHAKRRPWPSLPFLPIDHVYAGPGWATVSVRRGPRLSSDHYPVVVSLAPVAPR